MRYSFEHLPVGLFAGNSQVLALRMSPKAAVIKKPSIRKRPVVARPSLAIQCPQFDDDDRGKTSSSEAPPSPEVFQKEWSTSWKDKLGRTWELLTIREEFGKVREVWARQPPQRDYE